MILRLKRPESAQEHTFFHRGFYFNEGNVTERTRERIECACFFYATQLIRMSPTS